MKNCKKFFCGFLVIMTNFWRGRVVSWNMGRICGVIISPKYCQLETVHRTVSKGHCAVYRCKEGRSCSPLLGTLSRSSPPAPFGTKGDFAVLLKLTFGQLRPKGAALWTSAAFEKAGETFPYWTFRFAAFLLLL